MKCSERICGIWNLLHGRLPDPKVLGLSYIKGLSVRTYWRDVEKAEGVFDWSYFDEAIGAARDFNKPVMLRCIAGAGTPSYVLEAGAETYVDPNRPWNPLRLPLPWDHVFLAKYQKFIRAFAERYKDDPNVVLVHASPAAGGAWAEVHVAEALVKREDFTPKKLLDASRKVVETFAETFLEKSIGTPASVMGNEESYHLVDGLVTYLIKKYGEFNPKFYLSDHGLCERDLHGSWRFTQIWDRPIRRGFQMIGANAWGQKHEHRSGSYLKSLELALKYDPCYIEVYELDILGTPDEADIKVMAETLQKHWKNNTDK